MKKFLILLLIFAQSSAFAANCRHQKNPMGYSNYNICEVEETGYSCVSLEGKENSNIACFPTSTSQNDQDKARFSDRKSW